MNQAQENYNNSTTVYSKPLFSGGRNFVKYNSVTKQYVTGNTASTAVSDGNSVITINGVTSKELKNLVKYGLSNSGYSEHKVSWNTEGDTYDNIQKAGL